LKSFTVLVKSLNFAIKFAFPMFIATNCGLSFVYWVIILEYIFVTSCVLFYCVCAAVLHTLVAGLLARGQYAEGPATGHLGTGFLGFPVSKSECPDGSQDSQLLLHASHVALQT
jgi:hypothetical protein